MALSSQHRATRGWQEALMIRDLGSDRLFGFVLGAVFVGTLILNAMAY